MAEEKQTAPIEPQPPETTTALRDKRITPEGVVPKQAQGYVIAGLAVLILMAVMFSKNHAKPAAKDCRLRPAGRVHGHEPAEDSGAGAGPERGPAPEPATGTESEYDGADKHGDGDQPCSTRRRVSCCAVAAACSSPGHGTAPRSCRGRREGNGLQSPLCFQSCHRRGQRFAPTGGIFQRQRHRHCSAARSSSLPQAAAAQPAAASTPGNKRAPEVNVNSAHGQPFVVFEGTTIDTVLVNRLDGEFAGPLKVMVTNPIYSQDRQHLLIPEGTFILGDVQKVAGLGQKRLAVTFHRLLMPDGYSVDLDQFHGLDQAGSTGLKDKVNNHYVEIFGASIALGVIAGAAEATNLNQGYNESGTEAYKSGIASSLSQSSANVLDRFINIPPTITIREGHRIKVYITQDMLLPAYENHDMPGVM